MHTTSIRPYHELVHLTRYIRPGPVRGIGTVVVFRVNFIATERNRNFPGTFFFRFSRNSPKISPHKKNVPAIDALGKKKNNNEICERLSATMHMNHIATIDRLSPTNRNGL